jgi:hypothetical protein
MNALPSFATESIRLRKAERSATIPRDGEKRAWLPAVVPAGTEGPKLPLPVNAGLFRMRRVDRPLSGSASHPVGAVLMAASTVDLAKLCCPDCGTTYLDFRRTGRLGCPYDYVVFRHGLLPLLDRVQRARHHRGKTPRCSPEVVERHGDLRSLRRELREAAAREDYQRASELRDLIRSKERRHGSQ